MNARTAQTLLAGALVGAWLFTPHPARAHCDTMDGPVVQAAKTALQTKDITPVLKWVKAEAEAEIKTAFTRTLAVRGKGDEARELADQFFFETLVRVHRAGEGAPYTGLKPAGTAVGPAVEAADKALDTGAVEPALKLIVADVAAGIRQRFADARERKAHAEHNVEAGRAFVAAYVEYVHYVEGLHQAAQGAGGHHAAEVEAPPSAGDTHAHSTPRHEH